jgi:preprotein translocase subunit SecA
LRFDFDSWPEKEQTRAGIAEHILARATEAYETKERDFTPQMMRELEKFIMLQAVDTQWKDHLLSMDHLKDGIGLRGYGQRDPLKEYQKEGYELFLDMSSRIKEETVRNLFLVRIAEQSVEDLAPQKGQEMYFSHGDGEGGDGKPSTVRRKTDKVGRNSPCPCGSGKKFKKCCGKAA